MGTRIYLLGSNAHSSPGELTKKKKWSVRGLWSVFLLVDDSSHSE